MADTRPTTASYEADPERGGRVLLLYSGGLDTSVMLKWIQDEYEAEVVALTVNLGQPGEDFEVVKGKAMDLGALDCEVVDAREEFARDYVAPGHQGQRALRRRLPAVHRARPAADRQARGGEGARARLRHRRPRLHRQGQRPGADRGRPWPTLAPELKIIAPVRDWQMGREEEIAYAREHGIPVKGGTEAPPYSIDDNIWGRSSRGRPDRGPGRAAARRRLRAGHPTRATRPTSPQDVVVGFERGVPGGARRRAAGAGRAAASARPRSAPPRRRHRRPHRGPHRRPEGARPLRGAGGGDPAARPPGAGEAGGHDPPEQVQARARPPVGVPGLRRALAGAAARATSTPTWTP